MTETKLYIVRHGKTMFNTIGRIQGWCDTQLTKSGEEGIRELGVGLKDSGLEFKLAVSSDLGRTIQTMSIIQRELGILGSIPYYQDKRIREWCFGSFEGMYDQDLFKGVLPRINGIADSDHMTFEEIANGVYEADAAKWAETWEQLKGRILDGFTSIAQEVEKQGGGNALVVSHGMTIATLVDLLENKRSKNLWYDNGSITLVTYADGKLDVETIGDMSFRHRGAEIIAANQ